MHFLALARLFGQQREQVLRDTLIPGFCAVSRVARAPALSSQSILRLGAPELRVALVIRGRWDKKEDPPYTMLSLFSCFSFAMPSASSPSHDMQDHGRFPAASHSVSRSFASAADPKAATASARASRSQIQSIVLDVSSALAMALPRGLVRSVRAFEPALVGRLI